MVKAIADRSWCALVAVVLLCSGCATIIDHIDPAFVPDGREGVVYGRMEFIVDGHTLPQDARAGLIRPSIRSYVSIYGGTSALNTNAWKPGEFTFHARVSERGEFAAKLPVGRYYLVEFAYFGAAPGGLGGISGWRTYTEIMKTKVHKPLVVTFDVLPGKATYLGTIRHLLQFRNEKIVFSLEFADEYETSTEALQQRFPQLMRVTARQMYSVETLSAPLK